MYESPYLCAISLFIIVLRQTLTFVDMSFYEE